MVDGWCVTPVSIHPFEVTMERKNNQFVGRGTGNNLLNDVLQKVFVVGLLASPSSSPKNLAWNLAAYLLLVF
jgi:hypothetical protein